MPETTQDQDVAQMTPAAESASESEAGVELQEGEESGYSFGTKAYVVDKGALRDQEKVEAIRSSLDDEAKREKAIGQKGFKFWFSKSIDVSKAINPVSLKFNVPVLIDESKKIGTSPWVPTKLDNTEKRGLKPDQITAVDKLATKSGQGFFNKQKLFVTNNDLNTSKTLRDGKKNLKDINAQVKKAGVLARVGFAIGKPLLKNSRFVRKKVDKKIQDKVGEKRTQIDEIKEKAASVVKILKGVSLNVGQVKLTGLGLLAEFKGSFAIMDEPTKLSASFRVNTHSDYGFDYMGSNIENIPTIRIGAKGINLAMNLGSITHDPKEAEGSLIVSYNGDVEVGIFDQTAKVSWRELKYDTETREFEADLEQFVVNLKIQDKELTFTVTDPSFKKGEFQFSEASATLNEISILNTFDFKNINILMKKSPEGVSVMGESEFKISEAKKIGGININEFNGKVKVDKTPEKTSVILSNGNLKLDLFNQSLGLENVQYSSEKKSLSADNATMNLSVGDTNLDLTVSNPEVDSENGFKYSKANGKIPSINICDVFKLDNVDVTLEKENDAHKLTGDTDFSIAEGKKFGSLNVNKFNGHLSLQKTADSFNYQITKGNFDTTLFNQNVKIEDATYDNTKSEISAKTAGLSITVQGTKIDLTITDPSISKDKGFDFTKAEGKASELGVGEKLKFTDVDVVLEKSDTGNKIHGEADFSVDGSGLPMASAVSTGKLKVDHDDTGNKVEVENGKLDISILGQTIKADGVNFNSEEGKLSSENVNFDINVFDKNFQPTVEDFNISKSEGIDFKKATLPLNKGELNLGLVTIVGEELNIAKNDDGGFTASALGGLNLNVAPSMVAMNADGGLSYDFKNKKKDVILNQLTAKIKNPITQEIPKAFLGGLWPIDVSMGIPVFPGLSVELGFYMDGGVKFNDTIDIVVKKVGDNLNISIGSGITGSLRAGIMVGAQIGSSFIISLSIRLKAGGSVVVVANAEYNKTFALGSDVKSDEKLAPGTLLYDANLEVSLDTSLEIVGRLLYFFKKKFEKTLAKKKLADYRFTNKEKQTGEKALAPGATNLVSKDEVGKDMIADGYKGMSFEEIENIDQQTRFKNKDVKEITEHYTVSDTDNVATNFSMLSSFGKMTHNRVDYPKLVKTLNDHSNITNESSYPKEKLRPILSELGTTIHTKEGFNQKYKELILKSDKNSRSAAVKPALKGKLQEINMIHSNREYFYERANEFKSNFLHSDFLGDEGGWLSIQERVLRTGKKGFRADYQDLRTEYIKAQSYLGSIQSKEENFAKELIASEGRQKAPQHE